MTKGPKVPFPNKPSKILGPNPLKEAKVYLLRNTIDDPPRVFYRHYRGQDEKLTVELAKAANLMFQWEPLAKGVSIGMEEEEGSEEITSPGTEILHTESEKLTRNQRKRLRKLYKQVATRNLTLNLDQVTKRLKTTTTTTETTISPLQRCHHLSDSENSLSEYPTNKLLKKGSKVKTTSKESHHQEEQGLNGTNSTVTYHHQPDQQPSPTSSEPTPTPTDTKPTKYVPTTLCEVLPINLPKDCYNTSAQFLYDDNLVVSMNTLFDVEKFRPTFTPRVVNFTHGFRNLGATCFMNASLQCLFNCPLFSNYLLDTFREENTDAADLFPLNRLRSLANRLLLLGKRIVPRSIEKSLTKLNPFLERGYQHDAEEFLTALLGKLVDMSAKELKEQAGSDFHPCQIDTDPFTQMFGITSRTTLHCPCGFINYTQVQSLLLSLPVAPTLDDSLKQLSRPESLEDYCCPGCKRKGGVKKSEALRVPPQILVIRLNRSCFNENGPYKNKSMVKYPESLNLAPYLITGNTHPIDYQLHGIVLHEGSSVQSGHYIAQVRSPDDKWRQYDDELIHSVPSPTLNSRQAYVLFYTRQQPRPFQPTIPAFVIQDSHRSPPAPLKKEE